MGLPQDAPWFVGYKVTRSEFSRPVGNLGVYVWVWVCEIFSPTITQFLKIKSHLKKSWLSDQLVLWFSAKVRGLELELRLDFKKKNVIS